MREVAALLLAEGARTDKQDPYGLSPLQLAIENGHQEIANDLFPKCTNILASIKASEWRDCYGDDGDDLELYFDPMPAIRKVSIKSLDTRDYPLGLRASDTTFMFESSQNFMVDDIKSKRVLCVVFLYTDLYVRVDIFPPAFLQMEHSWLPRRPATVVGSGTGRNILPHPEQNQCGKPMNGPWTEKHVYLSCRKKIVGVTCKQRQPTNM